MPDRPMRAHLVVVSAPILHLFGRVRKRQEPVGVQALRPEATVEGLDVSVAIFPQPIWSSGMPSE